MLEARDAADDDDDDEEEEEDASDEDDNDEQDDEEDFMDADGVVPASAEDNNGDLPADIVGVDEGAMAPAAAMACA